MVTLIDLRREVDAAFAARSRGLDHWPNPHPDRAPLDEQYSRVSDPAKWRIVPARAEAWCEAAVQLGLAALERDVTVRWAQEGERKLAQVDRLVPHAEGALPLVLAYTAFAGVEVNGILIAAAEPAVEMVRAPLCGCDACDLGSQDVLELVDEHVLGVISGVFLHLTDGKRTIMVHRPDGWSASGNFRRGEVDAVLTDPIGWNRVSGTAW